MNKIELRQQIRQQKRQMTPEAITEKSRKLLEQFLATDLYRNATTLYGYMSYNQEVRTLPILEQALRDGKRVAIPKCYGDEMRFIYMEDLSAVEKSSCGIPEPIADERIGYGGGFYDKYLSAQPGHPTVALCFDFQMLPALETEEFDIPVDLVLWA